MTSPSNLFLLANKMGQIIPYLTEMIRLLNWQVVPLETFLFVCFVSTINSNPSIVNGGPSCS